MSYIFEHTVFGFCWWDLIAALILAAVIALFVWKHHEMKKQERDLEDQVSGIYANDAVKMDGQS